MKKEDKLKLKKLIYKLQTMGNGNSMVRRYFDDTGELKLHKPRVWQQYIDEHIDLFTNLK